MYIQLYIQPVNPKSFGDMKEVIQEGTTRGHNLSNKKSGVKRYSHLTRITTLVE